MPKGFKEYLNYVGGVRLGNPSDNITPIASLGDVPPKGQGGKDSRGVGLHANYNTQAPGTMRPFLTASAKKIQQKNWKEKGHGPYRKEVKENFKVADDVYVKNKKSFGKGTIYKIIRPHTDRKEPEYGVKWHHPSVITVGRYTKQELIKADFQLEDTNRIPKKPGQKAGSDKHSDLYTDEDPKGTIHGLGFTDGETARKSVNKIKNSGRSHAHKIQAAIAMSQRAKVASQRAKDPKKKKDLGQAHKIYQAYIDSNKKEK